VVNPPVSATLAPPLPQGPGSGQPAVVTTGGPGTFDVALFLGAKTFYHPGYTGSRTSGANIEGGSAWNGHETPNCVPAGHYFYWTGPLTTSPSPTSSQAHATAVSQAIAGRGPLALQQGIAYGANLFTGNIATAFTGGLNFDTTYASEWTA